MNNTVYLALGSNVGDRANHLREGMRQLETDEDIVIIATSSIYETEPVGYVDQDRFLNMVIEIKTSYRPQQLLEITQRIERESGRSYQIHWGPRTLDLDILLFNNENIKMDNLCIPHPRMTERAFVIVPLKEINPTLFIESENKTIDAIEKELVDKEGVTLWKKQSGVGEFGLFES
ncbi:2-amino-4-hydroxy-6-hydroxymethyldihydropteridine diphosphokinase [Desertibacillus haloalkaliphilus]|uniref:2-amino-4-hydroxy-6- hydroxymethyldihydropteridine diphosphokinase n=1 Tax=Desertibacillus haloalkaliphilus TaxID=1328930 RepID=UPI001C253EF8|nr:2-amino-4-hydroxy-6-hydroxymethyldihydropteridine diphosphokinase [Desertibacillus haloalkaliphilus]MBU8908458.1 2-amino-4-hydroxy-6-hydroxymethyldihydropteridine diphosphokinase [Desertibacillus haloalkaliphilus]